jgi:hypothetical protein
MRECHAKPGRSAQHVHLFSAGPHGHQPGHAFKSSTKATVEFHMCSAGTTEKVVEGFTFPVCANCEIGADAGPNPCLRCAANSYVNIEGALGCTPYPSNSASSLHGNAFGFVGV